MTIISPHRLVLVALAVLAGLVFAASPAAATDDPAPRPTTPGAAQPGGGAGPAPAGGQAPAVAKHKRAGKRVSKRVRVRVRHRKHHRGVRISLSGPGLNGVTRIEVLAHGRRIARDRSRPFRMVINGRRLGKTKTVQIRLVQAGSVRTITRRLRTSRRGGAAHTSAFQSIDVATALSAFFGRF
jgi:hypothetical protein